MGVAFVSGTECAAVVAALPVAHHEERHVPSLVEGLQNEVQVVFRFDPAYGKAYRPRRRGACARGPPESGARAHGPRAVGSVFTHRTVGGGGKIEWPGCRRYRRAPISLPDTRQPKELPHRFAPFVTAPFQAINVYNDLLFVNSRTNGSRIQPDTPRMSRRSA